MYKTCLKCKVCKEHTEFHRNKNLRDGYSKICKICYKHYYKDNKHQIIESASRSQRVNKEYRKKYLKEYSKKWRKLNPNKNNFKSQQYYIRKIKRMVPFTDKEKIREIYLNCPKGYEVDHIIPLKGELVSGLHVHYNLQYLPSSENRIKSNKFLQPEEESHR
jgi:hypothetical protein